MESATNDMAANLSSAIMNQDDPETVRDGAPAYLLLLDSFIAGSPDSPAMLAAAAELYAAYGVIFVADPARADRLTKRALTYGQRSLCASNKSACGIHELSFQEFEIVLEKLDKKDAASLFTYGLTSIAYIKVHSDDWGAMTKLPGVESAFKRVQALAPPSTRRSRSNISWLYSIRSAHLLWEVILRPERHISSGQWTFRTAKTCQSTWIMPATMHEHCMTGNFTTNY